jgi:hypothetical protein
MLKIYQFPSINLNLFNITDNISNIITSEQILQNSFKYGYHIELEELINKNNKNNLNLFDNNEILNLIKKYLDNDINVNKNIFFSIWEIFNIFKCLSDNKSNISCINDISQDFKKSISICRKNIDKINDNKENDLVIGCYDNDNHMIPVFNRSDIYIIKTLPDYYNLKI